MANKIKRTFMGATAGKRIALLLGVVIFSLGMIYVAKGWTEPGQTPPDGNVSAPVNVSDSYQIKSGGLYLGSLIVGGDMSVSDNVWESCAWTSYTCNANQICANGLFMAGVERRVGSALCGTSPNQYYQMRLYCCEL